MSASTSHRSNRQAGAAARRPARSRTINLCPCSNTRANSAITSSKPWCVAARHQSARRATATSCSGVSPCLPLTPLAARMAPRRSRSAHAVRAAIRAAPAPARSIEIANKSRARRPRCLRLRPPVHQRTDQCRHGCADKNQTIAPTRRFVRTDRLYWEDVRFQKVHPDRQPAAA